MMVQWYFRSCIFIPCSAHLPLTTIHHSPPKWKCTLDFYQCALRIQGPPMCPSLKLMWKCHSGFQLADIFSQRMCVTNCGIICRELSYTSNRASDRFRAVKNSPLKAVLAEWGIGNVTTCLEIISSPGTYIQDHLTQSNRILTCFNHPFNCGKVVDFSYPPKLCLSSNGDSSPP